MKKFTLACLAGVLFSATPACLTLDDDDDDDDETVSRTTTVEQSRTYPATPATVTTETRTVQPVVY
jgi:hypothetical protein